MMNKILNIYKPIGVTPYQVIQKLKRYPKFKDKKIAFAGRLDPIAHGVLILLIDEAIKERDKYFELTKQYEFRVLFGVSTDTYDVLGLFNIATNGQTNILFGTPTYLKSKIKQFLKTKIGKQLQTFPPYSSKEVNGKPLHQWARGNKLNEITLPSKEIEIYDLELISIDSIQQDLIGKNILSNMKKVSGDFRQKKIIQQWNKFFDNTEQKGFLIAKFKLSCSSGTYVRQIVHEMGEELGCNATTLEILRTKVGNYELNKSLRIMDSKSKLKL